MDVSLEVNRRHKILPGGMRMGERHMNGGVKKKEAG